MFPFEFEGEDHHLCSFLPRNDIPSDKRWCAIDNDVKSVGECKPICPKRNIIKLNLSRY